MLANVPVCATLPTTDLERAKRFYSEAFGLTEATIGAEGGAFFKAGGGTMLRIYERPPGNTAAQHTVAGFLVEDLEEEMSELRRRGVAFEEYDLPHLKTENGVYTDERRRAKGSWVMGQGSGRKYPRPLIPHNALARWRVARVARSRDADPISGDAPHRPPVTRQGRLQVLMNGARCSVASPVGQGGSRDRARKGIDHRTPATSSTAPISLSRLEASSSAPATADPWRP